MFEKPKAPSGHMKPKESADLTLSNQLRLPARYREQQEVAARASAPQKIGSFAVGSTFESTETVDIADLGIPGLGGTAERKTDALDGKAEIITQAKLTGLWHYSMSRLEKFTKSKAEKQMKFGYGTYFGAGDLKGETVELLKNASTIRHDVSFSGNVMAINIEDLLKVAADLRIMQGLPPLGFKTTSRNGPVTNLLEGLEFEGSAIDALLVKMGEDHNEAELVVLPSATDQIEIVNRTP